MKSANYGSEQNHRRSSIYTKRSGMKLTKNSELTVDHFKDCFIIACDPENNAPMSSKWISQQGYQSQSMYFFPVTND